MSQSHDMSHNDPVLSVYARHLCFLPQQLILDDLHDIHPEVSVGHDELRYISFTVL